MHILLRLLYINGTLWCLVLWLYTKRLKFLKTNVTSAEKVAMTLEKLGATFVKLGQGLSLHSEFLPPEYSHALERLQDHVEPCTIEFIQTEVEASFKAPLAEIFESFDAEPLGGGSVAQVHRARLLGGKDVIVKVRRPGIKRQIQEDIRILRWFLKSILLVKPSLRQFKPLEIVDELSQNLHKEIDFRQEAMNISRFVEMFKDWKTVYVPGVVENLFTEWVIVQDMSHGCRIDNPDLEHRPSELVGNLVDAFLHQCLASGTFHGDPHPGNLFVLHDGRICLHDFGLIGYLDRKSRKHLVGVMGAFTNADSEWLLDSCVGLGILSPTVKKSVFIRELEELIDENSKLPLKDWSLSQTLLKIARMGGGKKARLPSNIVTFIRAMFLIESTIRKLQPEFSLIEDLFLKAPKYASLISAKPNVHGSFSRVEMEASQSLQDLPGAITRTLINIEKRGIQINVNHRKLMPLREEVSSSMKYLSQSVIALGLYIFSALLAVKGGMLNFNVMNFFAMCTFVTAVVISIRTMRK